MKWNDLEKVEASSEDFSSLILIAEIVTPILLMWEHLLIISVLTVYIVSFFWRV